MAERSQFWTTNGTGHGVASGYPSDRWQALLRKAFLSNVFASGGVCFGVDNQLAVSGSVTPLTVATGAAFVYGFFYENDTSLTLAVTTPTVGTTGGHVVLRINFAAQTVSAVAVRNTDGVSAIPALTQTPGTTYEIRLATFTVTTGGAISVTDARVYAKFSGMVASDQLTNATLIASLGYTPLNKAGDTSTGQYRLMKQTLLTNNLYNEGLELRTDATIDATAVPSIGFHRANEVGSAIYLANSNYASFRIRGNGGGDVPLWSGGNDGDGSGLDADLVAGVDIAAITRQGGNATNWYTGGTTNYTPSNYRMQVGANTLPVVAGNPTTLRAVTFPVAFAATPVITLAIDFTGGSAGFPIMYLDAVTLSGFSVRIYQHGNANFTSTANIPFSWIAVGPAS